MATKKATAKATVKATVARATTDAPRRGGGGGRGRVDSGEAEFENLLRQMFVFAVHRWAKMELEAKTIDKMPTNEQRKEVVEDLVAIWACPIETTLFSAVETYLSQAVDEDEEVVDCPSCKEELELPEDYDSGLIECPSCHAAFDPDEDDSPPDGDGEPLVIDAEIVEDDEPRVGARAARGR